MGEAGKTGEDRLRRLLIFYDPLQAVASELQRIADSLEMVEMLGEAGVQAIMMLRRIEEQLDRLNTLMERICILLEAEGKARRCGRGVTLTASRRGSGGSRRGEASPKCPATAPTLNCPEQPPRPRERVSGHGGECPPAPNTRGLRPGGASPAPGRAYEGLVPGGPCPVNALGPRSTPLYGLGWCGPWASSRARGLPGYRPEARLPGLRGVRAMKGKMFLVPIYRDLRIRRIVETPLTICFMDEDGGIEEVELVEKTEIVCDACGRRVAIAEEELEALPTGYALCDEGEALEVVCEECRRRHYACLRVYDDLDEALGGDARCG